MLHEEGDAPHGEGEGEEGAQPADGVAGSREVVAGGWRQHSADAEKGYSDETTPGIQEGVWEFMQRAVPALQGKRVTHRWAGVMGFSGDGLPFIGDLPSKPRV